MIRSTLVTFFWGGDIWYDIPGTSNIGGYIPGVPGAVDAYDHLHQTVVALWRLVKNLQTLLKAENRAFSGLNFSATCVVQLAAVVTKMMN